LHLHLTRAFPCRHRRSAWLLVNEPGPRFSRAWLAHCWPVRACLSRAEPGPTQKGTKHAQQARMLSVWRIANVTGLHQPNPTSFFVVYIQLYANNCKICNSVLHLLLYIYYIPSMSLLFKVNCMHFFAESSEAPCLNKVAAPLTDLTEREHWFLLKFYCTLMAGWSM